MRKAAAGQKVNLWHAVRIAKNQCPAEIPLYLRLGGIKVPRLNIAESFAKHFNDKIQMNIQKTSLSKDTVYNGKCKLLVVNRHFMKLPDVKSCMSELNSKKCEGFDRIPLCVLHDSRETLLEPLSSLFDKNLQHLYNTRKAENCKNNP